MKDMGAVEDVKRAIAHLRTLGPSREKSLAITKLHEALLWLGVPLSELAEP